MLRNWVWGAATSAAKGAVLGRGTAKLDDQPCDLALVFALPEESGCFVDRLSHVVTLRGNGFILRDGRLAHRRIIVVESGAGESAAAKATDALIVAHRPKLILSTGFAGGLKDGILTGHILMPESVQNEAQERLSIDLKVDRTPQPALHFGPLVTVNRIVRTTKAKRALHESTGAVGVDMESYAIAKTCATYSIPFLAVKIISDAVNDELPKEIGALVKKKTLAGRMGVALGAVTRRPSSIKDIWNLKQSALANSERLAKYLEGLVVQI